MSKFLPPVGADLRLWAQDLRNALARTWDSLTFRSTGATAAQDGVLLWDPAGGYPVVSSGGEWRQLVMADGYASLGVASDVTAAAADTAYPISWDTPAAPISGVTLSGAEITFTEGGLYSVGFTAQIQSSSGSTVNFWFWPRLNGAVLAGSAIRASLHHHGATIVVSRSALFNVSAGDVLEALWATDSTNGFLSAAAATAFAPAAPAATLNLTRVRA